MGSRVYDWIGGRLKKVHRGEVLDPTSGRGWIGDKMARILEHLLSLTEVMPSWLKASGFVKDRKQAYVYIQRLVKLGVLEKTSKYGVYRVRHDVIARLLQLPVRRISEGIARARERLRLLTNRGGVRRASPDGLVCSRSGGFVFLGFGGVRYCGLFVDNVGCVRGGVYSPWPGGRGGLVEVRDLGLFCDGVGYFEVTHVVGGVSVGGQVVVYSNPGDVVRFGDCVRVEWRPPGGFVSSNGVSGTLRASRVEFVRAWVALSVVLGFGLGLSKRYLSSLYRWLGRLWGLAGSRAEPGSSSGCRAPSAELGDDGNYVVCFKCPPVLYRRLMNISRISGHDWNSIIVETLSGTLP
jgi:hypothetical protein